ncbi:MAG: GtrA family protein [Candidatus Cloacimonetes bacterium]|nr:GtrA family protein [Candidatus Cloacimonadota bacterium]
MFKRFLKFTLRGIAGAIVDTIVLFILTRFFFHSYFTTYILGPTISFEAGILVAYVICYFWIWNHRVYHNTSDFFRRIPAYNGAALISFSVKMALLITIERIFHFDVIICNLIALLFSGSVNFFIGEKIIFKEENLIIQETKEDIG